MPPKQGNWEKASTSLSVDSGPAVSLLKADNIKDPILRRLCYSVIVLRQYALHSIRIMDDQPDDEKNFPLVWQDFRDRDILKYTHDLAVLLIAYQEAHSSQEPGTEQLLWQQATQLLATVGELMGGFVDCLGKSIAIHPEEKDPYVLWLDHRRENAVFHSEYEFWREMALDALVERVSRRAQSPAAPQRKRRLDDHDNKQDAKRLATEGGMKNSAGEDLQSGEESTRNYFEEFSAQTPGRLTFEIPLGSGRQQQLSGFGSSRKWPSVTEYFGQGNNNPLAAPITKPTPSTSGVVDDRDYQLALALQDELYQDSAGNQKVAGARSGYDPTDQYHLSYEERFGATEHEVQEWQEAWENFLLGCENLPDDAEVTVQTATELYTQFVEPLMPLAMKFKDMKSDIKGQQASLPDLIDWIQNAVTDAERKDYQQEIDDIFALAVRPHTQTLGFATYDEAVRNHEVFEATCELIDSIRLFGARCQRGHLEDLATGGYKTTAFQPA